MEDAVHPTAATGVDDVAVFLAGEWLTHRRLFDRSSGMEGTFAGTTTFTPDDGGLRWNEEGTVSWPRFRGPATRAYAVKGEGSMMEVYFEDGKLLCRLDLGDGRARDHHDCSPDTYRVVFTITSPTTVAYSWDVTGPAKDLLLTTTLTRLV